MRSNRQLDEANEQRIADGERQYAESFSDLDLDELDRAAMEDEFGPHNRLILDLTAELRRLREVKR